MVQIKRLVTIEEIESIQDVEQEVWQMAPTPVHQTYTASKNGGMVLGAYDNDKLVGFQFSFPGFKNGKPYLCSHMLGILPDYRKGGLGEKMKEAQKDYAKELGYSLIVWTYDPLESINAYLNLHKLKGIGESYFPNYYGEMGDSLNKGLPTDRFLVGWWIQSPHVNDSRTKSEASQLIAKTTLTQDGLPVITNEHDIDGSVECMLAPIPENFQQMKKQQPELALEWRLKTRDWFQTLSTFGFVATDLKRSPTEKVSHYVFQKRASLSL